MYTAPVDWSTSIEGMKPSTYVPFFVYRFTMRHALVSQWLRLWYDHVAPPSWLVAITVSSVNAASGLCWYASITTAYAAGQSVGDEIGR